MRDTQREDFSNRRDYERELRTVSANIDMILGKNHEQEQQIEKEQNLLISCFHTFQKEVLYKKMQEVYSNEIT